ncbi:MAG: AraC family transcriptional regulator [Candidatus Pristimantibacillus lignocellulolyticus]|uniref:AraC family transcriptional regulator n=1 Tax=Candidatus Pristimantibacillus lignocellulolyticus TaxID=2994561 RepID=A0A9J6ZKK2_9BACL|nr:MAG: AraC family transcriptional regulator [Candidatus Pristimantibacillus lignocellulolyticus]
MIEFLPQHLHQLDLYLIQYGREQCTPGHSFGPAMREYYKFHYILEGKGVFEVNGKRYHLHAGQGFLVCPGTITFYQADQDDPWKYCWIGFHGIKAPTLLKQAELSDEAPIYDCDKADFFNSSIDQMIKSKHVEAGRELKLTGLLYLWLSILVECRGSQLSLKLREHSKEHYIAQVVHFIEMNYANKISVQSIASFIGLQRSYLSSLFKEVMNSSLQEYLITFRMRKACELLSNVELTIGDIARSVGYEDPLLFSKMFKKTMKYSPSQYREKQLLRI